MSRRSAIVTVTTVMLVTLLTLGARGIEVVVNDAVYPGLCLVYGPFASDSLVVSYAIAGKTSEGASFSLVFQRLDDLAAMQQSVQRQRSDCSVNEEAVIVEVSSLNLVDSVNYTATPFFFDSRFTIMLINSGRETMNATGFISLSAPTMDEIIASWIWYVLGAAILAMATSIITIVRSWLKARTAQLMSRSSIPTQLRVY